MTLLEQVTSTELAYYQQSECVYPTAEDVATWQRDQEVHETLRPLLGKVPPRYAPLSYARHLLERHGYSLHRYMARHLSPLAWNCWLKQGGILSPF